MTARKMAYLASGGRSTEPSAVAAYEEFRKASRFHEAAGYVADELGLFYWEHRVGAWMPPIMHESDIAVETHVVLNARVVLDRMNSLSVQDKKSSALFREVILRRWPELAEIPVNGKLISASS